MYVTRVRNRITFIRYVQRQKCAKSNKKGLKIPKG